MSKGSPARVLKRSLRHIVSGEGSPSATLSTLKLHASIPEGPLTVTMRITYYGVRDSRVKGINDSALTSTHSIDLCSERTTYPGNSSGYLIICRNSSCGYMDR